MGTKWTTWICIWLVYNDKIYLYLAVFKSILFQIQILMFKGILVFILKKHVIICVGIKKSNNSGSWRIQIKKVRIAKIKARIKIDLPAQVIKII